MQHSAEAKPSNLVFSPYHVHSRYGAPQSPIIHVSFIFFIQIDLLTKGWRSMAGEKLWLHCPFVIVGLREFGLPCTFLLVKWVTSLLERCHNFAKANTNS